MAKNSGNYGSIRKLNQVAPKIEDKVAKSRTLSHAEAGDVSKKFGNPITRGGHTRLRPAIDFSGGLELFLGESTEKALLQGVKVVQGKQQFQRKRDPSGKFAAAQDAGAQSSAEEDQTDQVRDARLRQHRQLDQLQGRGNPNMAQSNAKKGMVPGVSDTNTPESAINDTNSQVIGSTMSGQPIYEDPFHSAHQQFSEQDHQEAANLHAQQAQQAQQSGDMAGAAQHQSAAQSHTQQGQDQMAPGGRFMDSLFNQQGAPEVQPDDMGQFQDLLGQGQPDPMAGNPAIAGGVDPSMQQDPMMGQAPVGPDPMMAQPEPMAPSPIDAMMGQDTLDPMDPSMGGMPAPQPDPVMGQPDPMAQDPSLAPDPMVDPLADPMAPPQDSLSGFMDQGQGGMPAPEPGPIPGMNHSETGGPVGPQTDPAASSAGGGIFNLDDPTTDPMAAEADPMAQDPMAQDPMAQDPMMGQPDPMAEEDPMADPMAEEDPMAGEAAPEEDPMASEEDPMAAEGGFPPEEDEEVDPATMKAIAALRRYV